MALKNPYGLTLDLHQAQQCAGFDSSALCAFSASEAPELPEFPEEFTPPASAGAAAGAANVRMRIRDSAVLRSEQAAGFALSAPPEHKPEPALESESFAHYDHGALDDPALAHQHEHQHQHDGQDEYYENEEELEDEDVQDAVKLNFFVHNGYRYDGRLFKLRGPQERSQNSQPRRILQHTPAMLNLKQDFHRVYSEATYNTRPSSLRELRLSTRLSATSWASVSEMLAAADAPPMPTSPALGVKPTPNTRVSLLVENDLVTQEQASRIRVASPSAPPARARAPRAVCHIGNENAPPNSTANTHSHAHARKQSPQTHTATSTQVSGQSGAQAQAPVRKKKKQKSADTKRSTSNVSGVGEQRKKRQKSSNSSTTSHASKSSASLVAPHSRPTRNVLAPSNNSSNNSFQHKNQRQQAQSHAQTARTRQSTESDAPSGKIRPKKPQRSPAPKKKTFWQSLGLK